MKKMKTIIRCRGNVLMSIFGILVLVTLVSAVDIANCTSLNDATEYRVMNDIVGTASVCFNINNTDVTLDCQGFTVTGVFQSRAVLCLSFDSLTVKNCNFEDYELNLYTSNCSSTIYNNNFSTPSQNNVIIGCTSGVACENTQVYNNRFYYNGSGVNDNLLISRQHSSTHFFNNSFDTTECDAGVSVIKGYLSNATVYHNLFNLSQGTCFYERDGGSDLIFYQNEEGNYYGNSSMSAYSDICVDSDANGICDTSYDVSDWGSIDLYPLSRYYIWNPVTVSGRVRDIISFFSLESAHVIFTSDNRSYDSFTDAGGYYNINLTVGAYNYTIIRTDYITQNGNVVIDRDIIADFYLTPDTLNVTSHYSYYNIQFTDSVTLLPVSNKTVRFEYIQAPACTGAGCGLGDLTFRITDELGRVFGLMLKGTYEIVLHEYFIRDFDGFYKPLIEANMVEDYYAAFFARRSNGTFTLELKTLDLNTYLPIVNASVTMWNGEYIFNQTTDLAGIVTLDMPTGDYNTIITHPDYFSFFDTGFTIGINRTWTILLDPISGSLFTLCLVNLTDCTSNDSISGANNLLVSDTTSYSNTTNSSGTSCIENVTEDVYRHVVSKDEYKQYSWTFRMDRNTTIDDLCLTNLSNIPQYCISGNVTYNSNPIDAVRIQVRAEDGFDTFVRYTDINGFYEICLLEGYTYYQLEAKKSPFDDYFTTVQVIDTNVTEDISMGLSLPKFFYTGKFLYENVETLEWIPIQGVQVRLVLIGNTNISHDTITNLDGYFKIEDILEGNYTVYGTKSLFKPYSTELSIRSDSTVNDIHFMESSFQFTDLNLKFVDINGTALDNVRGTITSEDISDIGSSKEDGTLSFFVKYGEYTLNYERDGYKSGTKIVLVDATNNYYLIELELKEDTFFGIDYSSYEKWDKNKLEDFLWRVIPILFILVLFYSVYDAIFNSGGRGKE